jgi:hypothetical protein
MSNMFFAFPGGLAGTALLLLRASLVLFLVSASAVQPFSGAWATAALYLLAITITAGFHTRIAAALSAVGLMLLVWPMGWIPPMPYLIHALDAVALALIGPGAFSIDALMFGRRTMHLPG